MELVKVSIITPSFNQGAFIERTIRSVLTQDVSLLEYLVIDGGSADQTVEILAKYEHQLEWISEADNGQAEAINKGFKKATGGIIGWLNSDDIYYPDAIQTACQFFAAHPDIDVLYGEAFHVDANGNMIEAYPVEDWNLNRLKKTCFIAQPAVFFRRRVFDHHGFLNEKLNYCMDYEFWLRLGLQSVKFARIPQVLAGSRLHQAAKTMSQPLEAHTETLTMLRDALGHVPATWLVNWAVVTIKSEGRFKSFGLRYALAIWMLAAKEGKKRNKGLRRYFGFLTIPFTMLSLRFSRK